jgi:RNAse (barnase) inhibitor barstar
LSRPQVGLQLDRAADAGLRHIAPGQVEPLCAAARAAGLHFTRLDLTACTDKDELLARFAAAFEFPAWFGGNWDALADCLDDLEWLPGPGHVLLVEHTAELQAKAPETLATALEILAESSHAWQARGLPFWVLVARSRKRRKAPPRRQSR